MEDLGIVDSLAELSFAVQNALARRASHLDLTPVQARLLGVLRDREPSMNELAAHLELDKSSVSGLVDRAGARGLVRRVGSPHDGRAVHVQLTAEGRRLVDLAAEGFGQDLAELTAVLSDAQRAQLSRLASRIVTQPRV